jgi:predicted membrane-bound spermidine synthase
MFLVSGFCGLLYQVLWLRLAFAHFGVITPVLSLLVSTFMLGLGAGNYFAGKFIDRLPWAPNNLYAAVEALIGLSAFLVPLSFQWSEEILLASGGMDSNLYLLKSGFALVVSILPWCFLMGTTTPLIMSYIQKSEWKETRSFSYLYFANVVGATIGVLTTALVLVEFLGFKNTLILGAVANFTIAAMAIWVLPKVKISHVKSKEVVVAKPTAVAPLIILVLFLTGFSSMGMEVAWTRAFTPVLRTTIYSFAALLAAYLISTWLGAFVYRRHLTKGKTWKNEKLYVACLITSFLPVFFTDPRLIPGFSYPLIFASLAIVLGSLFPICFLLGYLTPKILDEASGGSPQVIARLYTWNIIGCIIGPLVVGYYLLPALGTKNTLLVLSLPFALLIFRTQFSVRTKMIHLVISSGLAIFGFQISQSFEDPGLYANAEVRRDHTATIISHGTGMKKMLLVNGMGITEMTPVTKFMAHLPLAHLGHPPESALVICFGMGTTFRSLMSWGLRSVKAVELVPSVKEAFGFYHADAQKVLAQSNGQVIIDDGRRFLKRTAEMFDVITLDPPPPVEAAGSSLLYSREFLALVKMRLKKGGILQHWFPGGDERILVSIANELKSAFPFVRMFRSVDNWGYHFLASQEPLALIDSQEFVRRLPESAKIDLVEWSNGRAIEEYTATMLSKELDLVKFTSSPKVLPLTDVQPANEYFLIRRLVDKSNGTFVFSE